MNQMKGYIDSSVVTLMKKVINNKYKNDFHRWTHCINVVTAEDRPGRENEVEYCYYKDYFNKPIFLLRPSVYVVNLVFKK